MAKMRGIKPEYWTDEKICKLKLPTRLFFIGLWSICDDYGVFEWTAFEIKMKIFPNDNVDVSKMLDELVSFGLIRKFNYITNKQYGLVVNFTKHQKVDKRFIKTKFEEEEVFLASINSSHVDTREHVRKHDEPELELEPEPELEGERPKKISDYSLEVQGLVKSLIAGIASYHSPFKDRYENDKPKLDALCQNWSPEMDKLIRLDKAKPEDVEAIINWLYKSEGRDALFWKKNILSSAKLREKYVQLVAAAQNERQQGPRMVIIS